MQKPIAGHLDGTYRTLLAANSGRAYVGALADDRKRLMAILTIHRDDSYHFRFVVETANCSIPFDDLASAIEKYEAS